MKKDFDINGFLITIILVLLGLVMVINWEINLFSDAKEELLIILLYVMILFSYRDSWKARKWKQ